MGKIMERIIEGRIIDWMYKNPQSQLAQNQYGFRKRTSTYDALYKVQTFVMEAIKHNEIVIGTSLDITNAFNSLKWGKIRQALKDKGFPNYIRRIIDSYLSERTIE